MSGGVPAGEAHDPGTTAYEAARLTIAMELRRLAVAEPKSGYREAADRLMRGEQYEIPSWVAMQLLARATPTPPIEGRDADVERVLRLVDKIDVQAKCLEGYAEQDGHSGKAPASVYHWQATHFRDIATEIRAALQALGERP